MLAGGNIWTEVVAKAGNPWTFAELAQFLRQKDNLRQLVTLLEKVYEDDKVEMLDPTVLTRILLAVKSYSNHHSTMLAAEIIDLNEFLQKIRDVGPATKYWNWLRLEKEEEKQTYDFEKDMLDKVELKSWMLPGYSDCLQKFLLPKSRATEFQPLRNVLKPIEFELPKIQTKVETVGMKSRNQTTSQQTKEKAFKTFFKDPGKQTLASNPRKRKMPVTNRPVFKRAKRARALTLADVEKMKAEERLAAQRKENAKKEAQLQKQQKRKRRTKVTTNPDIDLKSKVDPEKLKQMVAQGFQMNGNWAFPKAPKGHMNPSYSHLPHMNPAFVSAAPALSALPQPNGAGPTPGVPLPSFSAPQFPQPGRTTRKHAYKQVRRQAKVIPPGTANPPSLQTIPSMQPMPPMQRMPPSMQPIPAMQHMPPSMQPMPPAMQPMPPAMQPIPSKSFAPGPGFRPTPIPPVSRPNLIPTSMRPVESNPHTPPPLSGSIPTPPPPMEPAPAPAVVDPFSEKHHTIFAQKLPFLYNDCPDLSVYDRTEVLKLLLGKAHALGTGDVDLLLDRTNNIFLRLNTLTKAWKKIQQKD